MTTVRCPSCDAAVPADAAWCTLCFARLDARPSEPVVAAVPAPAPAVPAPAPFVPAPAPFVPAPAQESAPAATAVAEREEAPRWPCVSCDERVPLAETVCPRCGTPFLGGASADVSLKLPVVGDVVTMSSGARFGLMAGGAAVLALLLVLVFLVLGHIF